MHAYAAGQIVRSLGLSSGYDPQTDDFMVWRAGHQASAIGFDLSQTTDAEFKAACERIKTDAVGATTTPASTPVTSGETTVTATLYAKISRIQARGLHVAKNGTANVRGKQYAYSTLDDVLAACLPALAAEGLCLLQTVVQLPDGQQGLKTAVCDDAGHAVESIVMLPPAADWHAFGSGLTYAKRYGLSSLLGVAADLDDDGHAALPTTEPVRASTRPAPAPADAQPSMTCTHCGGQKEIGPRTGTPFCRKCWTARANGYASVAPATNN